VTIPLGHRCMGVLPRKAERVVDPLYAIGFVAAGADKPIVVLSVDWCEIRNRRTISGGTRWPRRRARIANTFW